MRGIRQQAMAAALVAGVLGMGAFSFAEEPLKIGAGTKAVVNYDLKTKNDDGTFENKASGKSLEYIQGETNILPDLAAALADKTAGDKVTVTIPPERAFGAYDPDNVQKDIPVANLPAGLAVGSRLQNMLGQIGTVTEIADGKVTIDWNHPLAGKTLVFELEVVSVTKAE